MKILKSALLVIATSTGFYAAAQSPVPTQVRYNRADHPGLVMSFPYSENVVETAVRNHFEKADVGKRRSSKGFDYYKADDWADIASKHIDIYTKVEGNKKSSTVSLLVSKGYDNFVSGAIDETMFGRMKDFMISLQKDIDAVQLLEDIKVQEDAVKDAEREVKRAEDAAKKLVDRQEDVAKSIADQQDEAAKLANQLEAQRTKLSELKSRVR